MVEDDDDANDGEGVETMTNDEFSGATTGSPSTSDGSELISSDAEMVVGGTGACGGACEGTRR